MNSEPTRLWNNSRFPLSLILDHSSNRVISLQLCLVFPNTVLFLVIISFLGVTRSHFQTISLGQGQGPIAAKMINHVSIFFRWLLPFSAHIHTIHSINCVSKWFKVLRSHFRLRSVCRSTLKRSTRLNLLLKGSVFAIRTKKKGLHSRQRFRQKRRAFSMSNVMSLCSLVW